MFLTNKFRFITVSVICLSLAACKKDFLEVTPKGSLIATTTLDYERLLNTITVSPSYAAVAMGDDVAAVTTYFSGAEPKSQRLFRWDERIYEPDETPEELPGAVIYSLNKIINEVLSSTEGSEEMKKSLQAEAKIMRALSFFYFVNYYAKPYDAATAAGDPGVPLILTSDITAGNYKRASVKEVYDFITGEITESLPHLLQEPNHRRKISRPAGEAILGKVYLTMGKFSEAYDHINKAITTMQGQQLSVGFYDYNETFKEPDGVFLPIGLFGPNYPNDVDNTEVVYLSALFNVWGFVRNELVASPETVQLYDPGDLRLKFFSETAWLGFEPYPNGMLRRTAPIQTMLGPALPDLFLMRAELKARNNDLPGAVQDVEALRKNRLPADKVAVPAPVANNQTELVKYILEERIREFAVSGMRWFDMRRLSVDPVYKSTVKNTHRLYADDGSIQQTFTLKPERFVLKFGQKVIQQNPNLEENP